VLIDRTPTWLLIVITIVSEFEHPFSSVVKTQYVYEIVSKVVPSINKVWFVEPSFHKYSLNHSTASRRIELVLKIVVSLPKITTGKGKIIIGIVVVSDTA